MVQKLIFFFFVCVCSTTLTVWELIALKYSVPKNKVPWASKNIKNASHNFRIIFHLWHKHIIYVICSCLSPVHIPSSLPFNFQDTTKFVRVLKIVLVPTYPIHHVHLDHDMWLYLRSPTIIKQIICYFLYLFMM